MSRPQHKLKASSTPRIPALKTDSQLQHDVNAELEWDPSIHSARIGVELKDGVVTLVGQVDSYTEKWNAERVALRVAGVSTMTTELSVHLTSLSKRTDADIAEAAENVLEWTSSLPANAIQVMVEDGWITLKGEVDWQHQRLAATDGVRYLMGVMGVSNLIGIKPSQNPVSAAAVKSVIEAALTRTSIADARSISVAVHDSEVTLMGTVHSWDERDTANNSAWGTPGVRNVVDKMTMAF